MELQFLNNKIFLENTILEHIEALIVFLLLFVFFIAIKHLFIVKIKNVAQKTNTSIDDTIVHMFKSLRLVVFFVVSLYLALQLIILPENIDKGLYIIFFITLVYQGIRTSQVILIELVFQNFLRKQLGEEEKETMATSVIKTTTAFILWMIGFLLIAQNLGLNITALLGGLGIGGIAIALASQNILSDLFSSFSIIFDKPFEVGDFIIINGELGTVKNIGLKTTRIESLHGEEIIVSNQDITSSTIHNLKRMEKRRSLFKIHVPYSVPNAKLKKIPIITENIINNIENAEFNRSTLSQLDKSYIVFEVVFYALTKSYIEYMKITEEILLGIKEQFEKENIEFAHTTETVILEK